MSKKGRKLSEETRKKMSEAAKKRDYSSMYNGGYVVCKYCNNKFYVSKGRFNIAMFCSRKCHHKSMKGKIPWNKGIKGIRKGYKHTEETKIKISKAHKGKKCPKRAKFGNKNPNWKNGATPINRLLRKRTDYKEFRNKIFKRDNYTCKYCGKNGIYLQIHHIKSWSDYPELRFDENNIITLCLNCHEKTNGYPKGLIGKYGNKQNCNVEI